MSNKSTQSLKDIIYFAINAFFLFCNLNNYRPFPEKLSTCQHVENICWNK